MTPNHVVSVLPLAENTWALMNPTTKGFTMPMLNEDQRFALALAPIVIVAAPVSLAARVGARIKKTAQNHPVATSIVVGSVAGAGLAVAMVDGDQVHSSSAYARIMRNR